MKLDFFEGQTELLQFLVLNQLPLLKEDYLFIKSWMAGKCTMLNEFSIIETAKELNDCNELNGTVLKPGSKIKPNVTQLDAEKIIKRLYGIKLENITELISYDDRNYLIIEDRKVKNPIIKNDSSNGYVFKIINALDSMKLDFFEAQTELLQFLGQEKIVCPKPVANIDGKYFSVENINGINYIVRLLEYIPGEIFHEINHVQHIYYECGQFIANIDKSLTKFYHKAYLTHESVWHLKSVPKLKDFLYVLKDEGRMEIVQQIIEAFEQNVLTNIDTFEKGIIHGDINEHNIIVHKSTNATNDNDYHIFGVIDFGDTNLAPLIFELAIAMAYLIIQSKDLSTGGLVIAGYNSIRNLDKKEKTILKECVAGRMCQSLVMGAYTNSLDPDNDYVLVTQTAGWILLESLWKDNLSKIDEIWQNTADEYVQKNH